MKNPFNNKKFKYGSAAVAVTLIFSALLIGFNVLISALTENYPINIDVTKNEIYSIGDRSRELLKEVDTPVTITFPVMRTAAQKDTKNSYILKCAEEYEKNFGNISLKFFDVYSNVASANEYKKKLNLETISPNCVIVETDRRCLSFNRDDFFDYSKGSDYAATGFLGEMKFTSAILQLTAENLPVACILNGHGEECPDKTLEAIKNSGFDIVYTDLATENIPENTSLIVMHNPTSDYNGAAGSVDEIAKIADYLNKGGNLFVFTSAESFIKNSLTEIDSLLKEWGVECSRDHVILDQTNAIGSIYMVKAEKACDDEDIFKGISSSDKLVVPFASPIKLRFETNEESGITAKALLKTFDTAFTADTDAEGNMALAEAGPFNLVTLSEREITVDGKTLKNHVVVFNTPAFAYSETLASGYKNMTLLYNLISLTGEAPSVSGIEVKEFDNTAVTIEQGTVTVLGYVCSLALPAIILLIGFGVFLKRRHM